MRAFLRAALRLLQVRADIDPSHFRGERMLVVANHQSLLDGVLLGAFLPVDATFVVHTSVLRKPLYRFILRHVRHLAVDPTNPLAMRTVVKLLEAGQPVVIFPEGRISITGSLMKIYDGAAFLAARTQATVVPVRIDGACTSRFGYLRDLYRSSIRAAEPIRLKSGAPFRIARAEGPARQARRQAANDLYARMIEDEIAFRPHGQTLWQMFVGRLQVYGRRRPLVEDIRLQEESYGSLLKMALGVARLMETRTAAGDTVGLLLPNSAGLVATVLGLTARGRRVALLNYTAGIEAVNAACTSACIRQVVASRAFVEKGRLEPLIAGLNGVQLLWAEDLKAAMRPADMLWVARHLLQPARAELPVRASDPAVVLFTSGSEGAPKGVVHTHASLLANAYQVKAMADFTPGDRILMALPMFHSFGLLAGLTLPLLTGTRVFLYPTPLHYRVIPELVYDRVCTVLFGTSTFLGNYARFAHPYDFHRLRYVVAGAEKLSDKVRATYADKFGVRILEGYGVTECAPVIAVNTPMFCKTGSVGRVVPGMQTRLEPMEGIAEGGKLWVRGPNVMAGYLKVDRPGELQPPPAGWYDTGDVVRLDEEGFLFIQGRLKRFAKLAGEMVSLEVAEKLATLASPAGQHAVASRPDASKGEMLVLFTTVADLTPAQLREAARAAGVSELAVARDIRHVPQLPLLGTGKTDYVTLNAWARA